MVGHAFLFGGIASHAEVLPVVGATGQPRVTEEGEERVTEEGDEVKAD